MPPRGARTGRFVTVPILDSGRTTSASLLKPMMQSLILSATAGLAPISWHNNGTASLRAAIGAPDIDADSSHTR